MGDIPDDIKATASDIWFNRMGFANDRLDQRQHIAQALFDERDEAKAEIARLHQAYRDEAQLRVALKPDTGEKP